LLQSYAPPARNGRHKKSSKVRPLVTEDTEMDDSNHGNQGDNLPDFMSLF